jgi:hypothetical protein
MACRGTALLLLFYVQECVNMCPFYFRVLSKGLLPDLAAVCPFTADTAQLLRYNPIQQPPLTLS